MTPCKAGCKANLRQTARHDFHEGADSMDKQLAELSLAGDVTAQYELARAYLKAFYKHPETSACVKALFWFIQAAERGNGDAVKWLKACHKYGFANKQEVTAFLQHIQTEDFRLLPDIADFRYGEITVDEDGKMLDDPITFCGYADEYSQGFEAPVDMPWGVGEPEAPLNSARAAFWYMLAAENGDEEAADRLETYTDLYTGITKDRFADHAEGGGR